MFNKAYELATLCDIDVCVIYYDRDGELIKTWPEDKSKVRDMAERFIKLNEKERRKKSNNLSQVLYKKLLNDKKQSLGNNDNKFSEKVSEMENSLENRLRIFQAKLLRLIHPENHTEPNQCRAVSSGFITTNLPSSSSQIKDPHQQWTHPFKHKSGEYRYEQDLSHTGGFTSSLIDDPHQKFTKSSMSSVSTSTEQDLSMSSLLNQPQSKFSIFLYNHGNGSFCQFPDSVSSFNQVTTPNNNLSTALLGEQGTGLRSSINNNVNLPMVFPPQMQTQNQLLQFDQFAAWNQPSFGDPMMFSS